MQDDDGSAPEGASPSEGGDRASPWPRGSTPPGPAGARNLRVVFAAAWIALQSILILTADRRPDGAFGFRMFNESSTIKVALYREIIGADGQRGRVHVDDGAWSARDAGGLSRGFTWYDRVPAPFWPFDREMHASYGASAQLARLQAALDDVAAHIPDDAETARLTLEVTVRRNGREPQVQHLASRERAIPSAVKELRAPAGGP